MKGVKELQKGDHIVHRGQPYRVLRKEIVSVGTHSHNKIRLEAKAMFTNTREIINFAPHQNVEDVEILRKKGQVISCQPLQIMDLVSYETLEAASIRGLGLSEGDEITFLEFQGKTYVIEKRQEGVAEMAFESFY